MIYLLSAGLPICLWQGRQVLLLGSSHRLGRLWPGWHFQSDVCAGPQPPWHLFPMHEATGRRNLEPLVLVKGSGQHQSPAQRTSRNRRTARTRAASGFARPHLSIL